MMMVKGQKTMTIDFEDIYASLSAQLTGNQRKLPVISSLGIYFGYSPDGFLRLSFLSSCPAPRLDSTKNLRVTQGEESKCVFWTCFDLLQNESKKVFFTFCDNIVESVAGVTDEQKALQNMKKRFVTWKAMFREKSTSGIQIKEQQGVYGELYFLKNYMFDVYGVNSAVNSWSGPNLLSKDFVIEDTWYEIKTVGANASMVNISSLAQLSSSSPGRLVIIRVEQVSPEFSGEDASISELLKSILQMINDDAVEEIFLSKLSAIGIDISDVSMETKFNVKTLHRYIVDDSFPRLTEESIQIPGISDVHYSLIINALNAYLEE